MTYEKCNNCGSSKVVFSEKEKKDICAHCKGDLKPVENDKRDLESKRISERFDYYSS